MKDRTGELCSTCKKGKLKPSGYREIKSPNKTPASGEAQRECTEYECDVCGHKCKPYGVVLNEAIIYTDMVDGNKKKHKK
jgi:hypothetical protein